MNDQLLYENIVKMANHCLASGAVKTVSDAAGIAETIQSLKERLFPPMAPPLSAVETSLPH